MAGNDGEGVRKFWDAKKKGVQNGVLITTPPPLLKYVA